MAKTKKQLFLAEITYNAHVNEGSALRNTIMRLVSAATKEEVISLIAKHFKNSETDTTKYSVINVQISEVIE